MIVQNCRKIRKFPNLYSTSNKNRKFEGKVPAQILSSVVFPKLGASNEDVLVGSKLGVDGALISTFGFPNGCPIVVTSDPITGATADLGKLAVIVNANDISVMGGLPKFMTLTLLLPPSDDYVQVLEKIMNQGISVIGGHTEVTSAVVRPVASVTMFGSQLRNITSAGAKEGDIIVLTKSCGLEGTFILLSEYADVFIEKKVFSPEECLRFKNEISEGISITKEASIATMTPGVHCMHDPTEGGLANALFEVSEASELGFLVNEDFIMNNTLESTKRICSFLGVNPLNLISSGSLLISADEKNVSSLIQELGKNQIKAYPIGRMVKKSTNPEPNSNYQIENSKGISTPLMRPETDELWKALEDLEAIKLELLKETTN